MKKNKKRRISPGRLVIVLVAMLTPLALMTPMIWWQAQDRADREALVTAATISQQMENTLHIVFSNVGEAISMVGKPCDQVSSDLARLRNLSPYFRALFLMQHGIVYCSSVEGFSPGPLAQTFDGPSALPPGLGITPVAGTYLVRNRPAVVVSQSLGSDEGVLAVIDGLYVQDIKNAASYDGQFLVQILLSESQRTLPDGTAAIRAQDPEYRDVDAVVKSTSFPVEVRVSVASSLLEAYRSYLWRLYAPFIPFVCLLMGYLAYWFVLHRGSLVRDMRRAIQQGEFHMVYQPVVRLDTGEFGGLEALVRWTRAGQSPIRPDIFIPLAEDQQQIAELTRHIFDLVVADLPQLGLGPQDHLGLNISGSHLAMPEFLEDIERLTTRMGPAAPKLVLELTEREMLPDSEQVQHRIAQSRTLGALWALDDFGTGHSSLSYLEQLDADFLKVDRSFVSGIGTESVNAVILETLISLAHRLGMALTAEGIETREQLAYLQRHNVPWGQGYLFSPPLSAAELSTWREEAATRLRSSTPPTAT
ncbi:EAL domain-containing protein [Pseudomonas sp. SBT1-2]|uniref:EAL domain-containing protein n=1 Tax=Pseudomonas sp. SBT1-2 TaxID=3027852 RepID=UPI0023606260|nr:cyclic diguanylate phosphodiesterase [Pseudomonas sp. SBT1-2]